MNPRTKQIIGAVVGAFALTLTFATAAAADPTMPGTTADRTMPHVEVGIPGKDVDGKQAAGAVEVRYSGGTTKSLVAPDPEAGSRFGTATLGFDIDQDSRQDVFVGAPGKDVDGEQDAGAVYLYRGTPNGLVYWKTLTMDTLGLDGSRFEAQAGARFGASMSRDTIQDIPHNTWISVGTPEYDVDGARDAGAVIRVGVELGDDPSFSGAMNTADEWPGGTVAAGDRFGAALAETDYAEAIGAPGKTVNGQEGAGAVFYVAGTGASGVQQIITQDSPDVPDTAETGDHFGAALLQNWDRLYVGAPGEGVDGDQDAGLVQALERPGWEDPLEPGPMFTQDSDDDVTGKPLAGAVEAGDEFGSAFAWYAPDYDSSGDEDSRIYIGAPGEDLGDKADAGMVNILHNPNARSITDAKLGGDNEPGDRFGAAAYARPMNLATAVIGVPGEDDGAGAVQLVHPRRDTWQQITGTPRSGDNYGAWIGSSL